MSDEPELLNKDPENEGWIVRFTFSDGSKLEKLMDQSSYDDFMKDNWRPKKMNC